MEWTADVAAGDWLRERLDEHWAQTMHIVVPRGFEAYARVFHPTVRERPVSGTWPAEDDTRAWEAFFAAGTEVDAEQVTWQRTADAFGTVMHPLAQWPRIVRSDDPHGDGGAPRDDDGWRYDPPEQGALVAEPLAALARLLAEATTTPDAGYAGVWEGWGGLVGTMVHDAASGLFGNVSGMPRRYAEYTSDDTPHRSVLYRSLKDVFNNPFRKGTWQPGILSDEISRGPRLELPNRSYVLFCGGVTTFGDPGWPARVPWSDHTDADEQRWVRPPDAPNLLWPDDHAWVMVSEIDFDSTIVAGSAELIAAIVADPALEAASIPADSDLSWDADEVNR